VLAPSVRYVQYKSTPLRIAQTGIYRVRLWIGKKNCYSNTMSIRFTMLCSLHLNTFYFLSLSSIDVLHRNVNESKTGNVDVFKVQKTCSEFNWMQCALVHLSRTQIDIKIQFNVKKTMESLIHFSVLLDKI